MLRLRTYARLALLLTLALKPFSARGVVQTNDAAASVAVTNSPAGNPSFIVNLVTNGVVEVTPYAPDVVRVRFHFAGLYDREEVALAKPFTNWPAFAVAYTNQGTNLLIATAQLQVEVVLSNRFQVHFRDAAGRDLLRDHRMEFDLDYHMIEDSNAYAMVNWPNGVSSVSNRPTGFKLKAIKDMPDGQAFFGLGDQGGPLNRRGQVIQFWNQDTYAFTEFHNPKYAALPMWYAVQPATTSRAAFAYGLFFNNPARPVVDLSGTNGTYSFAAGDDQLDYFFFGGGSNQSMAAILDRYSELTGRPAFLPKWAYGYHQSRHSYYTQQDVQDVIDGFRDRDLPCDAVYLDIGVQDATNGQNIQLSFKPGDFTNMPGLLTYATNQGVRLVPIVEPLLTQNDPAYEEASNSLYFIKQNNLSTYVGTNFLSSYAGTTMVAGISWLDFSIEATRDWWHGQLTNYLAAFGFEALWNDLTEPNENAMPLDTLWYLDGRYGGGLVTNDTRKWHAVNKNTYAVLASRVSERALRTRQPDRRPFVLTRGAWPGVQAYAAGWSGDNVSSFDHLRFNTRLASSVMISGQANFGNDVGGFVGNTTADLLTRWLQAGVLHPLYRNHNFLDLLTPNPQEPWSFGDLYTAFNRDIIQFRYKILPYLYSLAREASTNGWPVSRPVVFEFMWDTNTWSRNEYDLMAGSHLLAAPVVQGNTNARSVYLPAGANWFHWDADQQFAGGQAVTVPASIARLPLFAREGAIIPLGPVMNHVQAFLPAWLDLHVWPGASNRFVLYEDDGWSTNYSAGESARTAIAVSGTPTGLVVSLAARSGGYDPGARSYYLVAHALSNITAVFADGIPLDRQANRDELSNSAGEGWAYDTVTRQALAKLTDAGQARQVAFQASGPLPAPAAYSGSYTSMTVAGDFNLWNEAAQNMRLVASSQWAAVLSLPAGTRQQFKFVANNSWAAANWGEANQTTFTVPIALTAETGYFNDNIVLSNLTEGVYTFRFHEATLAYRVDRAATVDSDGDGMIDGWEFYYGLDPLNAGDRNLDLDGDGFANIDEYVAATRPVDANAYLAISSQDRTLSSGTEISWEASTGVAYRLMFSTNLLATPAFVARPPYTNLTGSGTMTVTDTQVEAHGAYRLEAWRSP